MITEFTPLHSLIGGGLIGFAVVSLMALHGRIAGISGIVSGLLQSPTNSDWSWRAAFVGGMILSPFVVGLVTGTLPSITVPSSTTLLIAGSFLVGIGVTFGSGCTSGHGVCGLSRLSQRSIVATLTFMATGVATVFIIRHVIGG